MNQPEINEEEQEISDDYQDFREIIVDPGQEQLRIDKFIFDKMSGVTRNRIQQAIRAGSVLVNEKTIKPNYRVRPNDVIQVVVPRPPRDSDGLRPEDIPLNIHYEDDDILIVNKEAGMVVHPGIGNHSGTLVNALAYHYGKNDLPVMEGNLGNRIGLVHRIDKDTSGLLVVAKTEFAMNSLAKQFFFHTIDRKYVALVWGEPDPAEGTIDAFIDRSPKNRTMQHVFPEGETGKNAITHYKTLEPMYYVSLVECQLETGRTHQIRVHMKYKGHPLFGDAKYGGDQIMKGTIYSKFKQFVENTMKVIPRQALHAKSLGFEHPRTGERVYFECEIPEDFSSALNIWRNYVTDRRRKKSL
ncbi:MAG: RluA family pseudouridine synthase [Saprospiraceae bacterium]|nr:RluA family pseudouridine synthase [Saprospiraceae bacterium]